MEEERMIEYVKDNGSLFMVTDIQYVRDGKHISMITTKGVFYINKHTNDFYSDEKTLITNRLFIEYLIDRIENYIQRCENQIKTNKNILKELELNYLLS